MPTKSSAEDSEADEIGGMIDVTQLISHSNLLSDRDKRSFDRLDDMLRRLSVRLAISGKRPVKTALASLQGIENDCFFWKPNCLIWSCVFRVVSLNLHGQDKNSVSETRHPAIVSR